MGTSEILYHNHKWSQGQDYMEVIRLPLQPLNGQSTWSSTAPILAASCPVRRGHVTSPGQRIVNEAHICHLQTKATASLFLGLQPQFPSRTVTTEVSHSKRGCQPCPAGPKRTRQKEFERVRPWPRREASAFQRTESILKPGTFSIPQRGGLRNTHSVRFQSFRTPVSSVRLLFQTHR